ncbi:cytochrome P450 [Xylariaceae sp. FL1272]|nr:cytochrome P450 [Xylariaceae sp. FL1272]
MSIPIGILVVVLCFVPVIMYTQWHPWQLQTHHEAPGRVDSCRQIANFSAMKPQTLGDRLILRASPNQRLIKVFDGVDNSFTTSSVKTHQRFLKQAHSVVHIHKTSDWIELGRIAETILDITVDHYQPERPYLPLASLIRIVSFGVMLKVLFDITVSKSHINDIKEATEAINRLWIQSKDKHAEPSPFDKVLLDNALRRLVPDEFGVGGDHSSPLNLLLPGYETLGRVVLLVFMATAYRNRDPETIDLVQEALDKVPHCFGQADDNEAETRARMIAKEGLRLYPPTKRIYRLASVVKNDESKILAADVEACHRDVEIWGPDGHEFRPARFSRWSDGPSPNIALEGKLSNSYAADISPSELRQLAYMPFSIGKHQCPAANGFGERMITLLVVKLIKRFGTRETSLKIHLGNTKLESNPMEPLPSGRTDLEGWVLELDEKGRVKRRST